jgi:rhamnose transport system permease protein
MNIVQSPQVQPLAGSGLELKVIAAAVVGGIAISGGRGRLWGAAVGLILLMCIPPALVHLRIEAYWEKAIQGAIILLAAASESVRPGRKRALCVKTVTP